MFTAAGLVLGFLAITTANDKAHYIGRMVLCYY